MKKYILALLLCISSSAARADFSIDFDGFQPGDTLATYGLEAASIGSTNAFDQATFGPIGVNGSGGMEVSIANSAIHSVFRIQPESASLGIGEFLSLSMELQVQNNQVINDSSFGNNSFFTQIGNSNGVLRASLYRTGNSHESYSPMMIDFISGTIRNSARTFQPVSELGLDANVPLAWSDFFRSELKIDRLGATDYAIRQEIQTLDGQVLNSTEFLDIDMTAFLLDPISFSFGMSAPNVRIANAYRFDNFSFSTGQSIPEPGLAGLGMMGLLILTQMRRRRVYQADTRDGS